MVREAIAKLRFEGVVETRQGVGVFVLGDESRSVLRIDAEILRDSSLMSSLFELRSIIEVEAAGLAAVRRNRKDLAAIKTAMQALYSSEGPDSSADADIEFHRAIVQATDNIYIATFINFIWEHVRTSIAKANLHLDHATRMPINRKGAHRHLRRDQGQGCRPSPRVHESAHRQRNEPAGICERDRGQEFVGPRSAFAPSVNGRQGLTLSRRGRSLGCGASG